MFKHTHTYSEDLASWISCCSIFSSSFLSYFKIICSKWSSASRYIWIGLCSFQDDRHTRWTMNKCKANVNKPQMLSFLTVTGYRIFNIDWDRCTPATIQRGLRCLGKNRLMLNPRIHGSILIQFKVLSSRILKSLQALVPACSCFLYKVLFPKYIKWQWKFVFDIS